MSTIIKIRLPLLILLPILLVGLLAASNLSSRTATSAAAGLNSQSDTQFVNFLPQMAASTLMTNCRYGVAITSKSTLPWVPSIGSGHYIKFGGTATPKNAPQNIEQIHLIRTRQQGSNSQTYTITPELNMDEDGLGTLILANPGHLWLVGNEVDVDSVRQDHTYPQVYAKAYYEVYNYIKDLDPYAHVAVAGLSMMTPGRLQYLDIVWNTYQQEYGEEMPVDVWNMHLYILSEIRPWDNGPADGKVALGTDPALAKKAPWPLNIGGDHAVECPMDDIVCRSEHDDIAIFMEQIVRMRTWMAARGQQNKPLIISEFSQLYPFIDYDDPVNPTTCHVQDEFGQCFTPARVTAFMNASIDYLESARDPLLGLAADDYRLVQHWTWFSLWQVPEDSGGSSNLLLDDYDATNPGSLRALSTVGEAYRDRIINSEHTYNLVAGEARSVTKEATADTADVELHAGFYNSGSASINKAFRVTFYSDSALTQVIGKREVIPADTGIINGCSWGRIADWATISWKDVPVGTHDYWVKVDSRNSIDVETNENDNVVRGTVNIKAGAPFDAVPLDSGKG